MKFKKYFLLITSWLSLNDEKMIFFISVMSCFFSDDCTKYFFILLISSAVIHTSLDCLSSCENMYSNSIISYIWECATETKIHWFKSKAWRHGWEKKQRTTGKEWKKREKKRKQKLSLDQNIIVVAVDCAHLVMGKS